MSGHWFRPISDQVLSIVETWYVNYELGSIYASRSFMSQKGVVEDRPTIYAHKIAFNPAQIKQLIKLVEIALPKADITKDLIKVGLGLKKGILVPPGYYIITMAFYKTQVKEVLEALHKLRDGTTQSVADLVNEQKDKAPFEL